MFTSIPGLYALDDSRTPLPNPTLKMPTHIASVFPGGQLPPVKEPLVLTDQYDFLTVFHTNL